MKRKNDTVSSNIEQVACIVVLLLFVILSIISGKHKEYADTIVFDDINEGWIDENGLTVNIYDLTPGDHSVTLDVSSMNTDGKSICFKSIDTNFKVYESDRLIYDYEPVIPRHLGVSCGMQYRKRMDFDKVISIIKEVSGTQLNPEVVAAFLRLVDKGEIRPDGK
ncbi:MAG: hypothetical protein K5900_11565 [Butyrivibrio sp.]|nr:hypothetical protein [Butyrivibrio sp.]